MATIQSLKTSLGVLKRNPILFGVGFLLAIVLLPQSALSLLGIPIVPQLIQLLTFFITPFIVAGLFGMAYEGRVQPTSFDTFKKIGKDRYVSVLLGNLVQAAIGFVFGIVAFIAALVTLGASLVAAGSGANFESIGLITVAVFGLILLVFLVIMFFLQFFIAAIVADDVGVLDGFGRSIGLVKENFVSALGFSIINLVVNLAGAVPVLSVVFLFVLDSGSGAAATGGTAGAMGGGGFPLLVIAGFLIYLVAITTVLTPFRGAFMMCFYDDHRPASAE
jgi:hypothetical protein